jgi:glucose/arabinose dehydrogenase
VLRSILSIALVASATLVPAVDAAAAPRFHGSLGGRPLNGPVRTIVATASGKGYYIFAQDGGVFAFGDARFRGSLGGLRLNAPIVDGALTPSGGGYYMLGADGGVFAFGNAPFRGSLGGLRLVAPVVGMAATPDGLGYLIVAADGGVFAFGSARFFGSLGGFPVGSRAVGIALRPQGDGYWIALADGRVFAFGKAPRLGNAPTLQPIVSIQAAPNGGGYLLVARDGAAFAFGSARFHGSIAGATLQGAIVDAAISPDNGGYWMLGSDGGVFTFPGVGLPPGGIPQLTVTPIASGLTIPWDLGFLPDGTMLFTERPGRINALVGGAVRLLAVPSDIRAVGEGGMTGLAIDPAFKDNRRIYTCFNTTAGDIKIVVWTIDAAVTSATRVGTLLGGFPANTSGRHSGCLPRVGPDGFLWVGTGDAAIGTNPQDPNSLGGKVLRIDRLFGLAAPANPSGARWYTMGHRNVQGLTFRPGNFAAYSVEHGPNRDDELNRLVAGGNYGWNPVPGYNESVPMTFAGAIPSVWSSGAPTIAASGATFVNGTRWRDWNGALMVCALKGSHLRVMILNQAGTGVIAQYSRLTNWGRLRTPMQGPDGNLYVTTANGGGNDVILRVTPS